MTYSRKLSIDLETFSPIDLADCGVYRYAEEAEVLLFAYAFVDDAVSVVDIAQGEQIPDDVIDALWNPDILKCAHNALFERTILAKHFNKPMPPEQWQCTQIKALYSGLPSSLDKLSEILTLDEKKMKEGKALITYFSVPCKPTKRNGGRLRNMPWHDTAKWGLFKAYCKRDVEVERTIRSILDKVPMPDSEWNLWRLDQNINDRGVAVDQTLIDSAIRIDETFQQHCMDEARQITRVDNPKSLTQLKSWLAEQGLETDKLTKDSLPDLIESADGDAKRILQLRRDMGKTSVTKFEAMRRAVCKDGRIRGLLQFYGASRTGRWTGRLVQVQNLPQNHMQELGVVRELVREGDYEAMEALYWIPGALSELIRTAFVGPFMVADFSAIEARVIAWLAGEQWRLDVFRTHGKIYEASASQMFKVPIESIGKGNPLRQKGKISELALGYQGGVNALKTMGALKMGIDESELPVLVSQWRNANQCIVGLWDRVQSDVIECIQTKGYVEDEYLAYRYKSGMLFIQLPSGRELCYVRPRVDTDGWKRSISYEGMNQVTKQWMRIETYGGRLVENIVQAISRDCLAEALMRLDKSGFKIVMHVHDEVVAEGSGRLEEMGDLMGADISWAPGLPLRADGYECEFYRKDG